MYSIIVYNCIANISLALYVQLVAIQVQDTAARAHTHRPSVFWISECVWCAFIARCHGHFVVFCSLFVSQKCSRKSKQNHERNRKSAKSEIALGIEPRAHKHTNELSH